MTIIELNKCKQCKKSIEKTKSLLKLKDNNWYCFSCILFNIKTLFSQLRINGYWYSLLISHTYPKYKKKVKVNAKS